LGRPKRPGEVVIGGRVAAVPIVPTEGGAGAPKLKILGVPAASALVVFEEGVEPKIPLRDDFGASAEPSDEGGLVSKDLPHVNPVVGLSGEGGFPNTFEEDCEDEGCPKSADVGFCSLGLLKSTSGFEPNEKIGAGAGALMPAKMLPDAGVDEAADELSSLKGLVAREESFELNEVASAR
jgi:hypothetical protein